jgi:hypothetical protein
VDEMRDTLCSDRETTQPNRSNVEYWAQGLTRVYLEGALQRAIACAHQTTAQRAGEARVIRRAPPKRRETQAANRPVARRAILDPYSVYMQGEEVLRSELNALSRSHVETIVDAYGFSPNVSPADLTSISHEQLIDTIVDGVRSAG